MLKSILNLNGTKQLTKSELTKVNGGIALCYDSGRWGPCPTGPQTCLVPYVDNDGNTWANKYMTVPC